MKKQIDVITRAVSAVMYRHENEEVWAVIFRNVFTPKVTLKERKGSLHLFFQNTAQEGNVLLPETNETKNKCVMGFDRFHHRSVQKCIVMELCTNFLFFK